MKPIAFHILYLSVIGILGFQLWTKTKLLNGIISEMDNTTMYNCEKLRLCNEMIFGYTERNFSTNPKYNEFLNSSKSIRTLTESVLSLIKRELNEQDIRSEADFTSLKDSLQRYHHQVLDILDSDQEFYLKKCHLSAFYQNQKLWNRLIKQPKTLLLLLQNKVLLDENQCLNMILDKVTICVYITPNFRL